MSNPSDKKETTDQTPLPEIVVVVPSLSRERLVSADLSDEEISQVFYRGRWEELQHLKYNPKLADADPSAWDYVSSDKEELFLTPWYPVVVALLIMALNLMLKIYEQFYSVVIAFFALLYISVVVPKLNQLKEKNRILFIDKILMGSPFDKNLFVKKEESTDKP